MFLVVVELYDLEREFGFKFVGSHRDSCELFDCIKDARDYAEEQIGIGGVKFCRCYWLGFDVAEFLFAFQKIPNSHGDYREIHPSISEETEDVPF